MSVLDTIGRTRLLPLRHIAPEGSARILVKLEYENPTGSMKDRMALAMVEAAEADGRLKPGGSVVEYTGGSTGVSRERRGSSPGLRPGPISRPRCGWPGVSGGSEPWLPWWSTRG